jgi:hypothetical protein
VVSMAWVVKEEINKQLQSVHGMMAPAPAPAPALGGLGVVSNWLGTLYLFILPFGLCIWANREKERVMVLL